MMPWNGWPRCAPMFPTKGNRWFVIMGIIAMFAAEDGKREIRMV